MCHITGLFEKIKYKAAMVGIEVIFTEEAYTSKASFLDHDPLPDMAKKSHNSSGKRIAARFVSCWKRLYGMLM